MRVSGFRATDFQAAAEDLSPVECGAEIEAEPLAVMIAAVLKLPAEKQREIAEALRG